MICSIRAWCRFFLNSCFFSSSRARPYLRRFGPFLSFSFSHLPRCRELVLRDFDRRGLHGRWKALEYELLGFGLSILPLCFGFDLSAEHGVTLSSAAGNSAIADNWAGSASASDEVKLEYRLLVPDTDSMAEVLSSTASQESPLL